MSTPAKRASDAATRGLSDRRRSAQVEGSPTYQAKRAELLQIAGAVFKAKGFEATTLNDIAERFGTDRAAIYYYFASKDELFQEVFHATAKTVLDDNLAEAARIADSELDARQKLRLILEHQIRSYEDNYPYVFVYIQEDMGKVAFRKTKWAKEMVRKTHRFESIVADIVTAGMKEGTFRDDLPVPLVLKTFFGMVNWTHRWLKPGSGQYTAEQTIDTFSAVFFDGFCRRAD